jgi:gas vesicle protein
VAHRLIRGVAVLSPATMTDDKQDRFEGVEKAVDRVREELDEAVEETKEASETATEEVRETLDRLEDRVAKLRKRDRGEE